MASTKAGAGNATGFALDEGSDAGPAKGSYKLWIEKPVGKFCLGFMVFVAAEVLVLGTLHWIFHFI
ncbi:MULTISPECIES: hypothetical protein [Rhodanobacter]|uniref:Uncharacterized protein n=1 Tax=Rhodanobacter denitrificans TaxID=666685 RepID=M4NH44_9GAMM|nr:MULTISPECIES: hypothetical protein [Rhodanobacter]AGG89412.1 hypothetical protein R2APBS1_2316 [Rhodanobacter denitrificans]UJJ58187.1 hypothetical protein LRK55_16210 [Rhodanobacter denitrificans]UJM88294.1 hypothetical protein LRJ86_08440 [Rhodanobacter denitrificans]